MKRILTITFAFLGSALYAHQINIKINGGANKKYYLGYYFGDKQYLRDSAWSDRNGNFQFKGNNDLEGGVYLIASADKSLLFDFIITEQNFSLETNNDNFVENMVVKGSYENEVFFKYNKFSANIGKQANELEIKIKAAKESMNTAEEDKLIDNYRSLMKDLTNERKVILENNPTTLISKVFRMMQEIDVPPAPKNEKGEITDSNFQYNYYKQHYFDNFDFSDDRITRTPTFFQKFEAFMLKVVPQISDSINLEADRVLKIAENGKENFKFCLFWTTNYYESSQYMGMDAVYVHLINNYYAKGKAYWVDDELITKMTDKARILSNVLIGKKIRPVNLIDINNGQKFELNNLKSNYTLIAFWENDCKNCEKIIDDLKDIYSNLKTMGVEVVSISGSESPEFIEGADWIQTSCKNITYLKDNFDLYSYPLIYILDKDKKIIGKRMAVGQIEDFLKVYKSGLNPYLTKKENLSSIGNVNEESKVEKLNIETKIYDFVKKSIEGWQEKDEFETSQMYKTRILKRDSMISVFTKNALQIEKLNYSKTIDWLNIEISTYDADEQSFKIGFDKKESVIIKVPIAEAKTFKNSLSSFKIKNQDFILQNNTWVLKQLEIIALNKSYFFDISKQPNYNPKQTFALNYNKIQLALQQEKIQTNQKVNNSKKVENIGVSDIDLIDKIPNSKSINMNAIAVIIGNTNYTKTAHVDFATNDAKLMKEYLIRTLGYKDGNILYYEDIDLADFNTLFGIKGNARGRLANMVKQGITEVFIYYAGHGAPGINDGKGYFVPVGCDPNYVENGGYQLDVFYENLAQLKTKSITVVTDACFSGANIFKNISPIGIRIKDPIAKVANITVFSSSNGTEVSSWYNEKGHGMFTYFFLKAIQDKANSDKNHDGKLTYQEIYDYLADNNEGVPYYARSIHNVQQNPTLEGDRKEQVFIKY